MKNTSKLPNLDSVRAIAALLVVISHIELGKSISGLQSVNKFFILGPIGVTIFFVLSGFLITYLLLLEYNKNSKVKIKNFYMRRILRIWPLYFLVLLIGVLIYPRNISFSAITLSVFFLPNIAFLYNIIPAVIDQIWSIGVEEQFYLIHPNLFRIKNVKRIFNVLMALLCVFYFLKLFSHIIHCVFMTDLLYYTRFDCLFLGSIACIWIVNRLKGNCFFKPVFDPSFLFKSNFQKIVYLILAFYLIISVCFINKMYNNQLLSFLVIVILANLALNKDSIIHIKSRKLEYVGIISYGVYLLHKFTIEIGIWIITRVGINSVILQNLFLYLFAISLTIIIASLSYFYFEGYFLKKKEIFSGSKSSK